MNSKLGAIALSADILTKANIGLWAFELDEGKAPRMYVDEAMLGLIGLTEQISPEETYHAWYDHIDEASYGLVAESVEKMTAGEHAEVQYPWHHPNGQTWIVRCGGVRNFEYTDGVRIEGTHQNVTDVIHFQEDRLKQAEEFRKLVNNFAENFDIVDLIHFDDDTVSAIKTPEDTAGKEVSLDDFNKTIKYYLQNIVFEADRSFMEAELDIENIRRRAAEKGSYTTEFRSMENADICWNEMSVVPMGKEAAALGIVSKNREIFLRKLQENQEKDYYALFSIDLDAGLLTVIKGSDIYPMEEAGHSKAFAPAMKKFAESQQGETREFFLRLSDIDHVKEVLRREDKRTYAYKSFLGSNEGNWVEVVATVISRHADKEPAAVALGFSVMDSLGADRQELKNELEKTLATAQNAIIRNDTLHEIAKSGPWSFILDKDDRIVSTTYSNELLKIIDQELSDSVYAWTDIVHPDDRDMALEAFNSTLTDKSCSTPYDVIYRMVNRQGVYHWFHSAGRKIRYADGTGEFFGMHIDITDQIAQQKKLEEAEENERFVKAMAQNYVTVYVVDMADDSYRVIKGKDDIHKRYSGLSFSLSMKKYIAGDVTEDDRVHMLEETDFERIRERLRSERTYVVRYRAFINNEPLWHEMFVMSAGQSDTVIMGMKANDREILAEKARAAIFNKYSGIYIADISRGIMKILKGSGGFEKYEGQVIPWQASMVALSENFEDEDKAFFRNVYGDPETIRKVLAKDNDIEYFYRSPNYGDGFVWMKSEVHLLTCSKDGVPETAMVGISSIDSQQREKMQMNAMIAEQKTQLEQQQARLEEALSMAQSANRAKTTFLNSMSHDIRTPMNAIIGYTGLAASHIDNKQQVQDYLSKIGQSSNHLLSLINDVLDMSRIESGKINLDEKAENLPEIIHTLRDIVQADVHAKQHDFFIDTVNVRDECVVCDKLRLNQALLNILSNSIKYTAMGGTISMRIIEKTVKDNGYATFEFRIKDNGMGMDEEFVKTIFDPFTRVRSSTVSGIQGTGLGMAITKNIIDMMGGRIEINSAPGKGTETVVTFDFKLQEAHKDNFEIPQLKGLRGLVVDDDANTCLSVSDMLNDIGMRYEWCTSGKEAVIRAEAAYRMGDRFKVYIIDWLMPDMNGIETVRRIRKVIGADTPIIILTSYDWSDVEEEAREAGVTAFVAKPMFPSDLNKVLSELLGIEKETPAGQISYEFAGKKILLVEDNELNREIAEEILEEEGFIVDSAEDGSVAVQKMSMAEPGDYDLILMDIQMPLMNGYEAAKQIRSLTNGVQDTVIIAMTANAFEEDRKAALEAGMNEHIAKPVDVDKLKATLARFL